MPISHGFKGFRAAATQAPTDVAFPFRAARSDLGSARTFAFPNKRFAYSSSLFTSCAVLGTPGKPLSRNIAFGFGHGGPHTIVGVMPPSMRNAAPFVADDSGLAT